MSKPTKKNIVTPLEEEVQHCLQGMREENRATSKEVEILTSKIAGKYESKKQQKEHKHVEECSIIGERVLEPKKISKRHIALLQKSTQEKVRDKIPLPPLPPQSPVKRPRIPQVTPCSYLVKEINHLLNSTEEIHPPYWSLNQVWQRQKEILRS